jgi:hypothetical protein
MGANSGWILIIFHVINPCYWLHTISLRDKNKDRVWVFNNKALSDYFEVRNIMKI